MPSYLETWRTCRNCFLQLLKFLLFPKWRNLPNWRIEWIDGIEGLTIIHCFSSFNSVTSPNMKELKELSGFSPSSPSIPSIPSTASSPSILSSLYNLPLSVITRDIQEFMESMHNIGRKIPSLRQTWRNWRNLFLRCLQFLQLLHFWKWKMERVYSFNSVVCIISPTAGELRSWRNKRNWRFCCFNSFIFMSPNMKGSEELKELTLSIPSSPWSPFLEYWINPGICAIQGNSFNPFSLGGTCGSEGQHGRGHWGTRTGRNRGVV